MQAVTALNLSQWTCEARTLAAGSAAGCGLGAVTAVNSNL